MSSEKAPRRKYELKRRAERQHETRQRIVEAAVELHTTVGLARTTVTAIAERAGVGRPTVYAHFPDMEAMFRACSGHVRATVPRPDPIAWGSISDPGERLQAALVDLYRYYARLEPLIENVQRDAAVLPIVRELNSYRVRYLEEVRDLLVDVWPIRGAKRTRLRRAIGHALEFQTWQSLVRRHGCETAEVVELMLALAQAAAVSDREAAAGAVTGGRRRPRSGESPSRSTA